jgi:hypothetical protein
MLISKPMKNTKKLPTEKSQAKNAQKFGLCSIIDLLKFSANNFFWCICF